MILQVSDSIYSAEDRCLPPKNAVCDKLRIIHIYQNLFNCFDKKFGIFMCFKRLLFYSAIFPYAVPSFVLSISTLKYFP